MKGNCKRRCQIHSQGAGLPNRGDVSTPQSDPCPPHQGLGPPPPHIRKFGARAFTLLCLTKCKKLEINLITLGGENAQKLLKNYKI